MKCILNSFYGDPLIIISVRTWKAWDSENPSTSKHTTSMSHRFNVCTGKQKDSSLDIWSRNWNVETILTWIVSSKLSGYIYLCWNTINMFDVKLSLSEPCWPSNDPIPSRYRLCFRNRFRKNKHWPTSQFLLIDWVKTNFALWIENGRLLTTVVWCRIFSRLGR